MTQSDTPADLFSARMSRRRFFCALAAAGVAAGLPLPLGMATHDVITATEVLQRRSEAADRFAEIFGKASLDIWQRFECVN